MLTCHDHEMLRGLSMSTAKSDYFIHPIAICDSPNIGAGTRIWAFSHILQHAIIGDNCNIGENVFIENHARLGSGCTVKNGVAIWDYVTIEDNVFLGPNMVFTNDIYPRAFYRGDLYLPTPTRVCHGASIGANATIVCGVTIGKFALIGLGTVVTKDVEPHAIVVGNPGRMIGRACICGIRLDREDYCKACNRRLNENTIDHAIACRKRLENKSPAS